jgi:hypothetical protein
MHFSYTEAGGDYEDKESRMATSRMGKGTMRKLLFAILLLTSPAAAWCTPSGQQDTIGVVRNSTGTATVTRGDQALPAVAGTKLLAGDTLSTGFDGSMGVILRDNSTLSLGPGSTLVIRSFLYSPQEGKLGLLARISSGTMAYISGLIGKLAPQSVRFDTPVATIGIRGTYFAVIVGEPASR